MLVYDLGILANKSDLLDDLNEKALNCEPDCDKLMSSLLDDKDPELKIIVVRSCVAGCLNALKDLTNKHYEEYLN